MLFVSCSAPVRQRISTLRPEPSRQRIDWKPLAARFAKLQTRNTKFLVLQRRWQLKTPQFETTCTEQQSVAGKSTQSETQIVKYFNKIFVDGSKYGQFPLFAGILSLAATAVNRLVLTPPELLVSSQSRSDVSSLVASLILIFSGILRIDIASKAPTAVSLEGKEFFEIDASLPVHLKEELEWMARAFLENSPTRSVIVCLNENPKSDDLTGDHQLRLVLRYGILGSERTLPLGSLLAGVFASQKPLTLNDVKLFPSSSQVRGALPHNIASVHLEPLGPRACLILGSDTPRIYTPQDKAWTSAVAAKLQVGLERYMDAETA